jgi:hypothetical protein
VRHIVPQASKPFSPLAESLPSFFALQAHSGRYGTRTLQPNRRFCSAAFRRNLPHEAALPERERGERQEWFDRRVARRGCVRKIQKGRKLYHNFRTLVGELADIDAQLKSGSLIDTSTGKNFSDPAAAERLAMIYTLDALRCFLNSQGFYCDILFDLSHYLMDLRHGRTAASLTANKARAGRKHDSPEISHLKGRIAGIARLQMTLGQTREAATAWVARKIPSELASRLSSKPIEVSSVKEWMERYDCGGKILDMFASGEGRKAFESCLDGPAAGEDRIDHVVRVTEFVREHAPKNKRSNSFGVLGFMFEVYIGASLFAEGYQPDVASLLADVGRDAVKLIPSNPSGATISSIP